jgi:hypothetical protein
MSTVSGLARETMRAFLEVIALAEPMIADLWKSHHLTLSHVQCMRILREQPEVAGDLARKLSSFAPDDHTTVRGCVSTPV